MIGIADNEKDSQLFENLYNVKPTFYRHYRICGVDSEANKSGGGLSNYFTRLRDLVKNQPIEDYTKDYILQKMRLFNYYEKSILVMEIESATKPLLYDKKYYVRKASSVEEVQPESYAELFHRYR